MIDCFINNSVVKDLLRYGKILIDKTYGNARVRIIENDGEVYFMEYVNGECTQLDIVGDELPFYEE